MSKRNPYPDCTVEGGAIFRELPEEDDEEEEQEEDDEEGYSE